MAMTSSSSDGGLVRVLGTWGLAAGIFNVTVGGGIFRLPSNPAVAGVLGPAAPLAYLVCGGVMALIVLGIAEAGSRVRLTGGPYAYVEAAFGPLTGFLIGVLTWLLGTTAMAAVADVYAANVMRLAPGLAAVGGRTFVLLGTFGFLATVNYFGAKQGGRLVAVVSVAKLLPLLLLLAFGIPQIDSTKLEWTSGVPPMSDLSRASVVLFFAYSGIESALVPSGEVKDTARTVPRAVFIAMCFVMVLYVLVQVTAQGILGDKLVGSGTPLADAAEVVMGPWGRTLLLGGVVVSTFGYMSGMTLAVPRGVYAFARDGFLPRALSTIHPRFRTPWVALLAQVSLVSALAVVNEFEALAVISNVAALLVYAACAVAGWQLKRTGVRLEEEPFSIPGGPLVPILACLGIAALLASVTWEEWRVLFAVIAAAVAIFFATAKSRRQSAMMRAATETA
jgi:basic amino acid/polyamine antiporter, APA family